MISVVIHAGPGLDDYTLHIANALASFARVGYSIDARQLERFGDAFDSRVAPIVFQRPRRRELWGFSEMLGLSRRIRDFHPEVVHLQNDGLWEMALVHSLGRLPLVNTVHDPIKHIDQRTWLSTATQRDAIKRSRGWVVHSEKLKDVLVERFPVDPARVLVHPHGIFDYYTRFAPASASRQKTILFFGELRFNKGCDILLRAFDSVKEQLPGWSLVIAGKGSGLAGESALLARLAPRLTLHNRFIADAEVGQLFSDAGIVALPYRHGSQSGVLALAAAFGCPVLATRTGSLPELLEDRQQALFVEPEDEASLAQGLITLTRDDPLRARIAATLYAHGRSYWNWQDIAEKTVNFYRSLI